MLKRSHKVAIKRKKIAFIIKGGEISIIHILKFGRNDSSPWRHGLPLQAGLRLLGGNPRCKLGSWVRVIARPFPIRRNQREEEFRSVELQQRSDVLMRSPRVVREVRRQVTHIHNI